MIGERFTGKICKRHPELKGERFKRNHACPSCQNGYTKQYNQITRDKAKRFDELAPLVLAYLDEPTGLQAVRLRELLK